MSVTIPESSDAFTYMLSRSVTRVDYGGSLIRNVDALWRFAEKSGRFKSASATAPGGASSSKRRTSTSPSASRPRARIAASSTKKSTGPTTATTEGA